MRRLIRWLFLAFAGVVAASALLVLSLRWIDPPMTAFMVHHAWSTNREAGVGPVRHQWVDWERISPHAGLAVVASEDQRFPRHWGFDFASLADAVREYRDGGRLRGASTISQQVAKNLFLWPERSFFRKGLEAYFTVLVELLWPKGRILEIYLNSAQFGPDIFGVQAASQRYFGKPASALDAAEAALLASVLPNPRLFRVEAPTDYVRQRQRWIQGQMRSLGGNRHLSSIRD